MEGSTQQQSVYWIQQGDVIIYPKAIPKGAKRVNKSILAEGEQTGHRHEVMEPDVCGLETYEMDGEIYIKAALDAPLTHQEHHAQKIPATIEHEIVRVQEYDHMLEEARQVAD